ncbi:hypothetical protein ACHQM5_019653 [Ranunculus cassubicifolius]
MAVVRDEVHTTISESDSEDDPLLLSSHTLSALNEFLNEQKQKQNLQVEDDEEKVSLVKENWNLSQFWYDQSTAETIAEEIQRLCIQTSSSAVVCIACPTLYAYLKKIDPNISIQLLEYDKRFEQYGNDFTFYDYNEPEDLPLELKHSYRVVVADPPYLSKECLEKVSKTMKFLLQSEDSYLLLLTGGVQKERAAELLGLRPCGFRPQHANKLGNEFLLYTNYDPGERLGGWELKE